MDDGGARRPPPPADGTEVTAAKWDRYLEAASAGDGSGAVCREHWAHHPTVAAFIDSVGGGPLAQWIAQQLPPTCRTVLSVGAGTAECELPLLAAGRFERLVAVDVSEGGIAAGRALADDLGVGDRVEFIVGAFDVRLLERLAPELDGVLFLDALHHLDGVDGVLSAVAEHVAAGGAVVGDEYVGPNRFGFRGQAVEIAKFAYTQIDPAVRSSWPELPLPDPQAVALDDPSEAVDAESILPALRRHFADLTVVPIGGAIAYPVWNGLDHDALYETEAGERAVEELLALDHRLTAAGVVEPYFCRFVGRQSQLTTG